MDVAQLHCWNFPVKFESTKFDLLFVFFYALVEKVSVIWINQIKQLQLALVPNGLVKAKCPHHVLIWSAVFHLVWVFCLKERTE